MRRLVNRTKCRIGGALLAMVLVLALGSFPGCSGCSGGKAPLGHVPQDALLSVEVQSLKKVLTKVKALTDKFSDNPVLKQALSEGRGELQKELKIDLEKPETLAKRGIDPDKGLVISVDADGESASIVLGVSDQKALDAFIREVAKKETGGAASFSEKKVGETTVTLLKMQGSDEPKAAYAYVKKNIIICPEAKDGKVAEYVAKVATLKDSIEGNSVYSEVKEKLGKQQAMVFINGETAKKVHAAKYEARIKSASSDWLKSHLKQQEATEDGFMAYLRGAGFSLFLSEKGVVTRAYMATPPEKGKALAALFEGVNDGKPMGKYLAPDALWVTRATLNAKKLMDLLMETVPPRVKRGYYRQIQKVETQAKISLEKDVLALLDGHLAMALYPPNLKGLNLNQVMRNPDAAAGALSAVGLVQVTDTKKAAELLAKLERMMVMSRVEVRVKNAGERKVYSVEEGGERVVAWTALEDMVVVATGDRLEKTVELIDKGGDNVLDQIDSKRAKSAFKADEGAVLYYNLARSAELLQKMELPAELKLMLSPVVGTLSKFQDTALVMEAEEDGVLTELSVRIK